MKRRNPEATREALLDAAEAVILEKGFGNAALSEIARRAKMTKSLIHHYFGTKQNMWQEVKTRRLNQFATQLMKLIEDAAPTPDLLRDSINYYFQFLKTNPNIVRIMSRMFMEGDADERIEKIMELNDLAIERIRMAQDAGYLRADMDSRFVLILVIGLVHQWFQNKEHFIHYLGMDGKAENSGKPDLKKPDPTKSDTGEQDAAFLDAMLKVFFEGVMPR